nr:hypothetical protein CFP56_26854 [Quercus suber]
MGQMIGAFEKIDWEDRLPRNLWFIRIKVRLNPWMPVVSGFMLRLDDGTETWVQCRYERVHKLCIKCGLIGHTRSQCSESMDEVERMLIRQRCWTTRARYGFVDVDNLSQEHPSHVTVDPEPQPVPAPNPNPSNSTAPTPHSSSHHHDFGHASLHSAIRSLSINRGNVPPTPVNSPTSPSDTSHTLNLNLNLHADPPIEPNPSLNSNTSMHATQENQNNNSLHEIWVNGTGPFVTNGELREVTGSSSATESDSETVVLFNLDRLNDNRPEWLRGNAWERGQIPESPNRLNNPVVNREERDGLQAAVGNVQSGPSSISASGSTQYQSPTQNLHELYTIPNLNHSVSLDTGLDVIRNSEVSDTASSFLLLLQLGLILAFVVIPKRDLVLSWVGLGGTLGRNCYVGLSPKKVPSTPLSIRFVHIILVIL